MVCTAGADETVYAGDRASFAEHSHAQVGGVSQVDKIRCMYVSGSPQNDVHVQKRAMARAVAMVSIRGRRPFWRDETSSGVCGCGCGRVGKNMTCLIAGI